jgi:hypothetical protein
VPWPRRCVARASATAAFAAPHGMAAKMLTAASSQAAAAAEAIRGYALAVISMPAAAHMAPILLPCKAPDFTRQSAHRTRVRL